MGPDGNRNGARVVGQANRVRRWLILGAGSAAAVLVIGGVAYLRGTQTTPTQEAELQTAVVRRGDLVISTTGSGTLARAREGPGNSPAAVT